MAKRRLELDDCELEALVEAVSLDLARKVWKRQPRGECVFRDDMRMAFVWNEGHVHLLSKALRARER